MPPMMLMRPPNPQTQTQTRSNPDENERVSASHWLFLFVYFFTISLYLTIMHKTTQVRLVTKETDEIVEVSIFSNLDKVRCIDGKGVVTSDHDMPLRCGDDGEPPVYEYTSPEYDLISVRLNSGGDGMYYRKDLIHI